MRRTWTWHFDLPPEQLWPVMADTVRFNEAMGFPPYQLEEIPQANGTVLRLGSGKAIVFTLRWQEKPFEWVKGRWFRENRELANGPFRRFGPSYEIEAEEGGTKVRFSLEWEPRGIIGRLLGPFAAYEIARRVLKRYREAAEFAKGARPALFDLPPPSLPEAARARAAALAQAIDRGPYGNGLGRRLSEYVLGGMASDVSRVRPRTLAREFGLPERPIIEGCLTAAHEGLLSMKWSLLCNNCRGAKFSTPALSELPRGAHCPSCNIDYERDFERNVELSFAAAPAIRPLLPGSYCLSGPMTTPHVMVQLLLGPGERRTIALDPPAGPYRLRTLHPGASIDIEHKGGAFPGLAITVSGVKALPPGKPGEIAFANDAGFEAAALIEDRRWTREALTAPEVISLQAFRDLFAEATLRPGDEAAVGQVALMFTDLSGSTAFYERVGDAVAYNLVREHFAFLAGIVRDHNGAVVKTIGDAVMASFDDPADAVRAALAAQAGIAAFNRQHAGGRADRAFTIKLGVHAGASVMVNLNDRMDYFGTTVNMAARLQGQSQGGDVVLSHAIARDPAVKPLLADVATREETVALKGFDQPVGFVRVLARA